MRILIKGGVWKNTEDEILKAAVMKYGKNQWARISSLLTRKSPKQCKARWFEWLDPSIKKTEWSKEEDEKLLHLAKLMPTQWRTIAPIVGRTPAQCLERYQKLLDEAEAKEGDGDAGPTGDDVRRLRPGEIDPDPEAKPARPDPVDMDEDEKEMLSEARARLANTQGKKAKRKAREKQLEEARRLAALQKRRELKAAGIEVRHKRKKYGMDYNADIPFHKKAPAGFWDVNEEMEREQNEKRDKTNILLSKLEGKRRSEIEEGERKKDAKRQKTKKEAGDYVPPQAKKAAEQLQFSERKKLVLPSPQVGESELEEMVKIGTAGENTRAVVDSEEFGASKSLLGDYSTAFRAPTPLRTPRTPAVGDQLKIQARNLRAMEMAQTPLLGRDLELEGSLTFEGATPQRTAIQTPNPLAAPFTPRDGVSSVQMTPRSGSGPAFGRTPLRDQMGINTPRGSDFGGFDETPRQERQRQNLIRQQLADHFKALPKPKNDFEIVLPESQESPNEDGATKPAYNGEEDAAEVEARGLAARKAAEEAQLKARSQAVQRDLPRPIIIQPEVVIGAEDIDDIDRLVRNEMLAMLQNDASEHPAVGQLPPGFEVTPLEPLEPEDKKIASQLIAKELENLTLDSSLDSFNEIHHTLSDEWVFVRGQGQHAIGSFKRSAHMSAEEKTQIHTIELDTHREQMKRDAGRAQKLEKKLNVVLGGYQARALKLRREVIEKWREIEERSIELQSFAALKNLEEVGAPWRVEREKKLVATLDARERELQQKYQDLLSEKETLTQEIVTLKQAKAVTNGAQAMEVDA
ncbi:pre-mRNA splicing factor component-domain-containing protein [Fimicolochytrium jonesii]|uniref:pre-mRNA splicing factor component-domain-containing protein n=1 Tax=Fimicolochytrium jonesii TaxID=1396493 RepID=UPI0022FE53E7|nr:pre-mRNA splicing factor component-domain-containing protein [Fimicolochytrium jonesii]KAI8820219.1 pre-mRNA splicing factor component-domain-containing protein [Fimicolochytrium jonesii]